MSGLISIFTLIVSGSAGLVDGAKLCGGWLYLFTIWFCANIVSFLLAPSLAGSALLNVGLAAGMVALLHRNARLQQRGLVAVYSLVKRR